MLAFLDTVLRSAKRGPGGALPDARAMLDAGAARIDELDEYPRARMRMTLGAAYFNLSLHEEALPLLDAAIDYFEFHDLHQQLAYGLWHRGRARNTLGLDGAIEDLRLSLDEALVSYGPASTDLALYYFHLAETLESHLDAASIDVRRSHLEHLETYRPDDELAIEKARAALGHGLNLFGRKFEGAPLIAEATMRLRELADPLDADLIQALFRLANVHAEKGDFVGARELLQEGLAKGDELWGADGEPTLMLQAEAALISLDLRQGRFEAAVQAYEVLFPRMQAQLAPRNQARVSALYSYCNALSRTNRWARIIELYVDGGGLEDVRALYGPQNSYTSQALQTLVGALISQSRWEEAAQTLLQLAESYPEGPGHAQDRALALVGAGQLLVQPLEQPDAARGAFEAALTVAGEGPVFLVTPGGVGPAQDAGIVALLQLISLGEPLGWEEVEGWKEQLADRRESLGLE
ncbi:MAG: hypothetical protein O2816_07215 [Planctomycetota bacterium]|nr:hypothetical protein [Planctomycetota bacterium]